jgi:GT2 family glycosyltransferase
MKQESPEPDDVIGRLERELRAKEEENYRLNEQVKGLQLSLEEIYRSRTWQMGKRLKRLKDALHLPEWLVSMFVPEADQESDEQSRARLERELKRLAYHPKISVILPITDCLEEKLLKASVDSMRSQVYTHWELWVAGGAAHRADREKVLQEYAAHDPRIRVIAVEREVGRTEAVNWTLTRVSGEFVGFLQIGDELSPLALAETVKLANQNNTLDLIYFDEGEISHRGQRSNPFFKPDWSPDLFLSMNYLGFTVIRKSLLEAVGGFRKEYEGSEEYDLLLQVTEQTSRIAHIPRVLSHRRSVSLEALSKVEDAAQRALQDALKRRGLEGQVEAASVPGRYRVRYRIQGQPKVSIIICTKDRVELLRACMESIESKTLYRNYEILVIDNGSSEPATQEYLAGLQKRHSVLPYPAPFHFAKMNNFAVERASGEYLLFLNNDTEVIAPEWMTALLEHAQRPEVGAVGAKLLFPNGLIQHAGVILGISGLAGHAFRFLPAHASYFGLADVIRNHSAVTGACLMMRRALFAEVGGFDESFAVALQDVDLCLRLRQKGYLIVYTPYALLYHMEWGTRGAKSSLRDEGVFKKKWGTLLNEGDPYYNLNLTLEGERFLPRSRTHRDMPSKVLR